MAKAKVKADKVATIKDYDVPVGWVAELNFFDLTGEKAGTAGSSNKMYHMEINVSKDGKLYQIYSEYGPTGKVAAHDWRYFGEDKESAEAEFNSIKKSKLRKGYVEIDVAQRTLGSDAAKQIVKPVQLNNVDTSTIPSQPTLHFETSRIISALMGATNSWVIKTLKCPLGQLTNEQVDKGRRCLSEAKRILASKKDDKELLALTNQFYGLIPHNLGAGARGQMMHLLIDDINKVAVLEDELDTLVDARSLGAVLSGSNIYDQYRALGTDIVYIEKSTPLFQWLKRMLQDTKASNHHYLGKINLLNAWALSRHGERHEFIRLVNDAANKTSHVELPKAIKELAPIRPDFDNDCKNYLKTNTWPLFHGTRTQNVAGIMKKGILIRPAGVIICGAMYGNGSYFASQASKSAGYSSISNSIWAKGGDRIGYIFLSDVLMGNPLIATGSSQYSAESIRPKHSVWAVGGRSGIINDEMILYETGRNNLRYFLEFDCVK